MLRHYDIASYGVLSLFMKYFSALTFNRQNGISFVTLPQFVVYSKLSILSEVNSLLSSTSCVKLAQWNAILSPLFFFNCQDERICYILSNCQVRESLMPTDMGNWAHCDNGEGVDTTPLLPTHLVILKFFVMEENTIKVKINFFLSINPIPV